MTICDTVDDILEILFNGWFFVAWLEATIVRPVVKGWGILSVRAFAIQRERFIWHWPLGFDCGSVESTCIVVWKTIWVTLLILLFHY